MSISNFDKKQLDANADEATVIAGEAKMILYEDVSALSDPNWAASRAAHVATKFNIDQTRLETVLDNLIGGINIDVRGQPLRAIEPLKVKHLAAVNPNGVEITYQSFLTPEIGAAGAATITAGAKKTLLDDQERHDEIVINKLWGRTRHQLIGAISGATLQEKLDGFRTIHGSETITLREEFAKPLYWNFNNTEFVARNLGQIMALSHVMEYDVPHTVGSTDPLKSQTESLGTYDVKNFIYDLSHGVGSAFEATCLETVADVFQKMTYGLLRKLDKTHLENPNMQSAAYNVAQTAGITKMAAKKVVELYQGMTNKNLLETDGNDLTAARIIMASAGEHNSNDIEDFFNEHLYSTKFNGTEFEAPLKREYNEVMQMAGVKQALPYAVNADKTFDLLGNATKKTLFLNAAGKLQPGEDGFNYADTLLRGRLEDAEAVQNANNKNKGLLGYFI